MNTIVVGYDGSDSAERAVREAADLARDLGATLHLVTALDRDKAVRVHAGEDWTIGGMDDAEQRIANLGGGLSVEKSHAIVYGSPADTLIAEASRLEARCIVVGNRRTSGISRVLGSVASSVIREAPCAVYVAQTTGDN